FFVSRGPFFVSPADSPQGEMKRIRCQRLSAPTEVLAELFQPAADGVVAGGIAALGVDALAVLGLAERAVVLVAGGKGFQRVMRGTGEEDKPGLAVAAELEIAAALGEPVRG